MDLNQFETREKASEGVDIPLVIDGETVLSEEDGKPIVFRAKGVADPHVHAVLKRVLKTEATTAAEDERKDMDLIRASVIGWSDNFTVRGEKVPFSKENIEKVFGPPVMRRALVRAISDEHRFMNGASPAPRSTSSKKPG